jgi:putative transposase
MCDKSVRRTLSATPDRYLSLMPYPLRIEHPGAYYHVGSRGNNGRPIMLDDADGAEFVSLLAKIAIAERWSVVAWCLMTNHYHLVLQIEDRLSRGMQSLNGTFSKRFNRRHGRENHLFRNRFYSRLLKTDADLLEACRYTVLNPVRAGICQRPEQWRWSSFRACAGLELPPSFLADAQLLKLFANDPARARAEYREFIAAGLLAAAA